MTSLTRATLSAARPRKSIWGFLSLNDLYVQRRRLAKLDDAQLRDIGLSREEALTEASRPVWDAPQHWFR